MTELATLDAASTAALAAKAHYVLAQVLNQGEDIKQAVAQSEIAVNLAVQGNDKVQLGYALCLRAAHHYRSSEIDEAFAKLARARSIMVMS